MARSPALDLTTLFKVISFFQCNSGPPGRVCVCHKGSRSMLVGTSEYTYASAGGGGGQPRGGLQFSSRHQPPRCGGGGSGGGGGSKIFRHFGGILNSPFHSKHFEYTQSG